MKAYQRYKLRTRMAAIEYQIAASEGNLYMSEVADWTDYFRKWGKRFGLLREFRENGII